MSDAERALLEEALQALRDSKVIHREDKESPLCSLGICRICKQNARIDALLATDAARQALARRERREQELLVLFLVEAGELTEGQGAKRLGIDRLDLRTLRLQALGKIAQD